MNSASDFSINLNKNEILISIEKTKEYKSNGVTIHKWENSDLFSSSINLNNIHFLGILNQRLEKEGYALFSYINEEKYFGNFSQDLRSRHGLYSWPSIINNNIRKTEFFWGTWKNNLKDGKGIYAYKNGDRTREY